ncbi:MAG: hypothetical protein E7301_05725 [Butyrivibrio sp.]|nr:hypothetical protein [Butyrivibrio sp.]
MSEKTTVETEYGAFIPCYDSSDYRKRYRDPIEFYESGAIRSIYLQDRTLVCTKAGVIHAEMITFYENGNIKRIFPTYGKLTAYYTEDDEYEGADIETVFVDGKDISAKMQCVMFHPCGSVKSITIYSRDSLVFKTRYGEIKTSLGAEFTENGNLRSLEPVFGTCLETKYGIIHPFNPYRDVMHAENASLAFNESGKIEAFSTIQDKLTIRFFDRRRVTRTYEPAMVKDSIYGFYRRNPMQVMMDGKKVSITLKKGKTDFYDLSTAKMSILQ